MAGTHSRVSNEVTGAFTISSSARPASFPSWVPVTNKHLLHQIPCYLLPENLTFNKALVLP